MNDQEKASRDIGAVKATEDRESMADGMTRQDHESVKEAAGSRPAFDDDQVTPRFNDGR